MPGWEKGTLLAELPADAVDALLAAAGPQLDIPLIMVESGCSGALARQPREPNAVAERLLAIERAVDPDRVFSFGWAL